MIHCKMGDDCTAELVVVSFENELQQSKWVAQEIATLRELGIPSKDLIIFCRGYDCNLETEDELTNLNLDWHYADELDYDTRHIEDVLAFLKVASHPREREWWQRILNLVPGIDVEMAVMLSYQIAYALNPLRALSRISWDLHVDYQGLLPFSELLMKLILEFSPSAQINILLPYIQHSLPPFRWAREERLEDIVAFRDYAAKFATSEAFLMDIAMAPPFRAGYEWSSNPEDYRIMFSDVALDVGERKWSHAFLIGAVEGNFPAPYKLLTKDKDGWESSERKLFENAIPHATKRFCICTFEYSDNRTPTTVIPSRFISELPKDRCRFVRSLEPIPEKIERREF